MANIRTFNAAKLYADLVLHPLIKSHTDAKLKTSLGAISIDEASKLSPGERTMCRFNSLKERMIIQQTLSSEIEATVRLNKVKCEIELLEAIKTQLSDLESNFEEKTDDIISFRLVQGYKKPVLSKLFSELNNFLDSTYVNIQRLMTKNKLLFNSDDDEFLEDQEIKAKIIEDNRRA